MEFEALTLGTGDGIPDGERLYRTMTCGLVFIHCGLSEPSALWRLRSQKKVETLREVSPDIYEAASRSLVEA